MTARLLCSTVTVLAFVLSLGVGASDFGIWQTVVIAVKSLLNQPLETSEQLGKTILFEIRAPRTTVAAICGGSLAAAGVVSQGLFRNTLASPSILGTTAGGSLAAAAAFYFAPAFSHWLLIPVCAFLGALAATGCLFRIAMKHYQGNLETLLLAGFAVNALLGAGTSFIVSLMLEDHMRAAAVMHWLLGGFSAKGWNHLLWAAGPIILGLVVVMRLVTQLDVLALGEDIAKTLSVDMMHLKKSALFAIALLVGSAVSQAGAVPFVGLMVPHLTRLMVGPKHRELLFCSILNGMTLTMIADLAARTVRAPAELEVGILTSLLGAPFFLWLLSQHNKGKLS